MASAGHVKYPYGVCNKGAGIKPILCKVNCYLNVVVAIREIWIKFRIFSIDYVKRK